jgi:hypothetical protein
VHDVRKEGGVSSIVADEQKRPIRRPKPLVALKAHGRARLQKKWMGDCAFWILFRLIICNNQVNRTKWNKIEYCGIRICYFKDLLP